MSSIAYLSGATCRTICQSGVLYMPAWKHYNNESLSVNCDCCLKSHLKVSIGYAQYDLCMACVERVADTYCKPQQLPAQDLVTEMCPSLFSSK